MEARTGGPYLEPVRLLERDRELDVLTRAMAGAGRGLGSGVAVVGEPGAGKTALVSAACDRVLARSAP